jgi:hypothetical protein
MAWIQTDGPHLSKPHARLLDGLGHLDACNEHLSIGGLERPRSANKCHTEQVSRRRSGIIGVPGRHASRDWQTENYCIQALDLHDTLVDSLPPQRARNFARHIDR